MSVINAIYSVTSKEWLVQRLNFSHGTSELKFIFRSAEEFTYFTDLKFGFVLTKSVSGEKLYEENYPDQGEFEGSDGSALVTVEVKLIAGDAYDLFVYAENSGERTEHTLSFTVPFPEKPYDSWIWQNETWNAPVEKPGDGPAIWNESTRQWDAPPPAPSASYFWNGSSWECIVPKPEGDNWTFDEDRREWRQG